MFNFLNLAASNPTPEQIAQWCRRLGWVGLVLQALLGFIPLLVVVMRILTSQTWQGGGFGLGLGLAILCLLALLFSIFWCFRYTQLATRMESPDRRPSKPTVQRALRVGLLSNLGIVALATLIALWRVTSMTLKMLAVPQGAMVAPNAVAGPGALITPSNMITIHAMISTIAAGLVGLVVALLLIYQVGRHRIAQDSFG